MIITDGGDRRQSYLVIHEARDRICNRTKLVTLSFMHEKYRVTECDYFVGCT